MHSHVHSGKTRTKNKLLTFSFSQATIEDSCLRATEADSCPRTTRENSWRHQPRELRLKHKTQKGMSTENTIGVQTRAMAQRVDNEANLEQGQKRTDQATTPTIELHRTKEDTIKEFIQQHGTINLDWYVPDLCNTRVHTDFYDFCYLQES